MILDSLPEPDYENLTLIAPQICNTPLLKLFSSIKKGNGLSQLLIDSVDTPRDLTFCGHAINATGTIMIIPDARTDVRFQDNH
jgi:hypothetical protein